MKTIKCPNCGHTMKEVIFNGYQFGDRLLEGVMFIATLQEDGSLKVMGVTKESKPYFDKLNPNWLDIAQKFIDSMFEDVFAGCSNCKYDLCMAEDIIDI